MEKSHPNEERLDAGGQLVIPGLICAHTHFYGAFARGMALPSPAPVDFPEILSKLWWRLDKALTLEDVRYSTEVMLLDAIRNGVTSLVDHHASPNAIEGSLDAIAEEIERSGLRAALCYEVTDRDGPAKAKAGIEENMRFNNRLQRFDVAEFFEGIADIFFAANAGGINQCIQLAVMFKRNVNTSSWQTADE